MNDKDKIFWEFVKQIREVSEMQNDSFDRFESLLNSAEDFFSDYRALEMEYHIKKKLGDLNEKEFQKEQQRKQYQNQTKEKDANTTKAGIRLN
jgi:hypothetical protein